MKFLRKLFTAIKNLSSREPTEETWARAHEIIARRTFENEVTNAGNEVYSRIIHEGRMSTLSEDDQVALLDKAAKAAQEIWDQKNAIKGGAT